MLRALGVEQSRETVLLLAIVTLVALTPMGSEATHPLVLVAYRILLLGITIACIFALRQKLLAEICPVFLGVCALLLSLMLLSVIWNPGSKFDGYYRWYQHLLFGSAFLALAALHRNRSVAWKRTVLWAVVFIDTVYVVIGLIAGERPLIGPFINANYFASFLLVGFSAAVSLALFERERLTRLIAGSISLFLYFGMTQAWSRGATIAAIAVGILAIVRFARNHGVSRVTVAIVVIVVLVAGALSSSVLVRKFLDRGESDPYNYLRPKIWLSALRVTQEHPLLGVGFGQFYFISKQFSPSVEGTVARYLKRPGIAHSEYLQYAAETGIPAAMLLIAVAGYLVTIAIRRARTCPPGERIFQEAAILTAAGLGMHALVDNNWTVPVMAAGLIVFSLADVLPVPSLRLSFRWSPRCWALSVAAVLFLFVDTVLVTGSAIYFNEAGHSAYERGEMDRAESLHSIAAALAPAHDVFLDNAGMVYFDKSIKTKESRWLDYAETLFRQALEANPNSDTAGRHLETLLFNRLTGNAERDKKIHAQIAAVDREILRIDPFNPFVRKNLAEALYLSGSKEAAQQELTFAIEVEPNYVPGYLRISEWFRDAGDMAASNDYRQKALEVIARYQHFQTSEPYEAMLLGRTTNRFNNEE